MKDKRKFRIGQTVRVNLNHRLKVDYDEHNYRRIKRSLEWGIVTETNDLVLAVITGVKLFQEGRYYAGSSGGVFEPYDYEPGYLEVKQSIDAWGVRTGYKNKEIYFFEEDITKVDDKFTTDNFGNKVMLEDRLNIPYLYTGWTSHARKRLSEDSKTFPRDSKGRWT